MALTVLFTDCNVEDPIVDSRDAFIGQYQLTTTGSITFVAGTNSSTMPLNNVGTITISKDYNSSSLVNVSGFYNCKATVNGNNISMDNESYTYTEDGVTMQLVFDHLTGTLQGNTLVWTSTVNGTISNGSATGVGSGGVQNVATK